MSVNYFKLTYFSSLIFSILLGLSSVSFFGFWVSLELNMMSFVCLLSVSKSGGSFFNSAMYFLPQALSSSLVLISVLFMFYISSGFWGMILALGLTIKLGLAPMHYWFIQLSKSMSFDLFVLLSTVQKVLPLFFFILMESKFFWGIISVSVLVSVLGSISQNQVICLLAYSSIFSSAWVAVSGSFIVGVSYLAIYFISLSVLGQLLSTTLGKFVDSFKCVSTLSLSVLLLSVFSLMGIPPLASFVPKLFIIQELIFGGSLFLAMFLTVSSFIFFWVLCELCLILISGPKKHAVVNNEVLKSTGYIASGVLLMGPLLLY